MRRRRLLLIAAVLSAVTVLIPGAGHAAVVRRLDLAVTTPMPGERLVASGVTELRLRPIALQADIGRNRAWVVVGNGTSTATGSFRIAYAGPVRLGALRLRALGMPARGLPVATPIRTVTVTKPALSLVMTGSVGATLSMTATASPARPGRLVVVQRRLLGGALWTNALSRREGATSATVFAVPLGAVAGTHEFRVTFAGPAGAITSGVIRMHGGGTAAPGIPPAATGGPVRATVALQPAPGPASPALDGLAGTDADFALSGDRWNPCTSISYRVNASAAPAGLQSEGAAAIAAALTTVSSDSGLQFRSLGSTTFAHPAEQSVATPAGRPADAAMTIAFVAGDGAQFGEAGHAYVRARSGSATGPYEIITGDIVIFLGRVVGGSGAFDASMLRETLLHELGHGVGLGHHVDTQVMARVKSGSAFSEYQRGDRAGLLAVGSPAGCL